MFLSKEPQSLAVPIQGLEEAIQKSQQARDAGGSPTGKPVIPPAAVPYALAGVGLLQVVEEEVSNPGPWDGVRVLRLAIRIGTYLTLGALPGLRRK